MLVVVVGSSWQWQLSRADGRTRTCERLRVEEGTAWTYCKEVKGGIQSVR